MRGGARTAFIDILLLIVLALILLPHRPAEDKHDEETPPGQILIEIRWPDDNPADVDLWTRAPDGRPVGYSARESRYLNLLRDDLGHMSDFGGLNYENTYSRGSPAGEYVVNIVLYRGVAIHMPVSVMWRVSIRIPTERSIRQIADGEATLGHEGQEMTVLRFTLDDGGQVISQNSVPIGLWRGTR